MPGKPILALALVGVFALAIPAWSLDLEEARTRGLLGEQADGYVGAVVANPGSEVVALAKQVNARRRAHYEEIAARNGTPVEAVAALAGKKLIEGAPSGQWVKPKTEWVKKP
jgi:uncharacterized protein YdbL (DUF1318 family)